MLLDGDGKHGDGKRYIGETVEVSGSEHYFRTQVDFCDQAMATIMGSPGVMSAKDMHAGS